MIVDLPSLEETLEFGRRLGKCLFPGAVVALVGPLGAGKTHLVRGVCEGADIPNSRVVNSPTFVLVQEYDGRFPIFHFDAYRLRTSDEFEDLGIGDYYEAGGVCLIEWADRVRDALPLEYLEIDLAIVSETARRAGVTAQGEEYLELVCRLQE